MTTPKGRLYIDFETKSYCDLKQTGAWVYSLHPSTEIICLSFRIRAPGCKSSVTRTWVPGREPLLGSIVQGIKAGWEVEAHNYAFEFGIWENIMVPRYGAPPIAPEQWRDTMAVASYYAMPAALDALCRALGWEGKDPEGSRLITKYSKLNLKTAKTEIPPEDLEKFIKYCERDVVLEEAVSDYLGDLPERELEYFILDCEINQRGLYLDEAGITTAAKIVDQRSEELTERFRKLTGLNPTQTTKLIPWFAEQGLALDNMQADYIEDLIEEGEIPSGPAREALEIRLKINKASTKKLDAMLRHRDPRDGRAKFQSRYHGAATGRDTGSGFQPLNLVRSWEDVDPDDLVRDVMYGNAAWLDCIYGDAMEAVSKAGRHWIKAEPGNKLIAGDFVSIEAVILAVLAGEQWKVEAFRSGAKIYELMADKIYGLAPGTVTKKTHPTERQDGKTGELAFGYQGNLGAWLKFDNSGRHTDERIKEICKTWRGEHPNIVALWAGLEEAAFAAVAKPGNLYTYREAGFEIVDEWLTMILPNGKRLWYRDPELRMGMPQWHQPAVKEDCAAGACRCEPRAQLTYKARKEGQWKRVNTYGGKLTENYVQGTAREYLMPSVEAAENAGYSVILKVYDEVVAEVPKDFGSVKEFEALLADAPGREWAEGWPIRVDAWEGKVYRK